MMEEHDCEARYQPHDPEYICPECGQLWLGMVVEERWLWETPDVRAEREEREAFWQSQVIDPNPPKPKLTIEEAAKLKAALGVDL